MRASPILSLFASTVALGCGSSAADPVPLPPLASVTLTDEGTLTPTMATHGPPDSRSPARVADREAMLTEGYGAEVTGAGEAHVTRTHDDLAPPPDGPVPTLLARFVHFADLQLGDDESPTRLANFDSPGITGAAYRPHDAYLCRMTNAMVRTFDAIDAELPIGFVLLGGDNIDSAQTNELDWFLSLLGPGGNLIDCDSGADDDPVRGRDNDPKDPFVSFGLAIPYVWVTGNHDVLVQGNITVNATQIAAAVGGRAASGTRDWSMPGGPVRAGSVPEDPRRQPLYPTEILERVAADGDGHGVSAAAVTRGRGTYAYDVTGTPLRIVVVDTTAPMGSEGEMPIAEATDHVRPLLVQAQTDGRWVMLASHHSTTSMVEDIDTLTAAEWIDLQTEFPNVLFSFVGHSHEHRIQKLTHSTSGHVVWEVMTSALADHPHQARLVEIWDADNGYVRLHTTVFDFATDDDPLAAEGRALGVLDFVAGWVPDGRGAPEDRNADLYVPAP